MFRFIGFFALYCCYTALFAHVLLYSWDVHSPHIVSYILASLFLCLPYFLCGYAINNVRFANKGRMFLDIALIVITPLALVVTGGPLTKIILSYAFFAAFWITLAHFFPIQSWTKG